jgi:hypothetical protein
VVKIKEEKMKNLPNVVRNDVSQGGLRNLLLSICSADGHHTTILMP